MCVVFLFALLASVPALAQDRFAPPALKVIGASQTHITLRVTAGPSGAPGGITVEWMRQIDFMAFGWPADRSNPTLSHSDFVGVPTWHTGPSGTYLLNSGESVDIVIGELFDETGLTSNFLHELPADYDFVFRAYARPAYGVAASSYTAELYASSRPLASSCTFTQGYWKTHAKPFPGSWPVVTLTLGTTSYNQQQLLDILNAPADGNALIILAHQLIAAKLNLAQGADATCIASTIANADAFIGSLVIPPVGSDNVDPNGSLLGAQMVAASHALDEYNNGLLCSPHCETAARRSTWGALKTRYR